MRETWSFIRENLRFLMVGILLTFFSSLGQSFFFGIYNADIREAFDITNAQFGSIYGTLTMLSALTLIWVGPMIDRVSLHLYIAAILVILTIACLLMGLAPTLWLFIIALFLTRFSGQGLCGHAASTAMARYFDKTRGRAVTIGRLGFDLGVIVFPLIAVFVTGLIGWRMSWVSYAAIVALIALPSIMWLLNDHNDRHTRWEEEQNAKAAAENDGNPLLEKLSRWSHLFVLKDWRFYAVIPAVLAEPMIVTGIFFFLSNVAEAKDWPLETLAKAFSIHAVVSVVVSLLVGQLIDKIGSIRLLPFMLVPQIISLLILGFVNHAYAAPIYMFVGDITKGFVVAISITIWAELYGVRQIGAIKSLVTMLMVLSTAIMPILMGMLLDMDILFSDICLGLMSYSIIAMLISLSVAFKGKPAANEPV